MAQMEERTRTKPRIGLVIPCFNEEKVLPGTSSVLLRLLHGHIESGTISEQSSITYIDDGSGDETWQIIESLHQQNPDLIHGVKLAHNRGHQNALFAGLMNALDSDVDAAISMDADLQDDPNVIGEMINQFILGCDIVYGVRDNRATDTFFKRTTAHIFYSAMKQLGTDLIPDHADFRLMSRTALNALSQYREVNLFLRGVVPSLGFKSSKVYYKRGVRIAGESKYPLRKMISFAIEGITSFSVRPLQLITYLGMLSVLLGFAMLIYSLVSVFSGSSVAGWASIMCSLWLLGGMILLSLGVLGSYLGKIYMETKHRPRFIEEDSI